jgi:NitT/TauT family transport system ATP-binding protein
MVFQEPTLFPWLTVVQNVAFGLRERRVPKGERQERARTYLDLVGLNGFADARPHELSGGMKQRVAIARALALEPGVLLMDEPFGALDAQTRERLQDELLRLWEQTRKTILFVTHNVDEATYLADRVLVFTPRPGRVQANVTVDLPRSRSRISEEVCPVRRRLLTELKTGINGIVRAEPCCPAASG